MVRRRNTWIFFGIFLAILISTTFTPDLRLNAELAAARREGMWATPEEIGRDLPKIPAGENAMDSIKPLVELEREQRKEVKYFPPVYELGLAIRDVLNGKATEEETMTVRGWYVRNPEMAEQWREVSEIPGYSSGTDWSKGSGRIWESFRLRYGVERLLTAAVLGFDSRKNLIAAARLGAFPRREPGLISQSLSYPYAEQMLKLAKRLGIVREVDAAMGPAPSLRQAYRGLMADEVDAMEQIRRPEARNRNRGPQVTLEQRIRQLAPFAAGAKIQVVGRWRQLWKLLPADPTDYMRAADVLDREIPKIDADIYAYSSLMDPLVDFHSGYKPGDGLRTIGRIEALRKSYRAGASPAP